MADHMADLGRLEGVVRRKVDFDYKDASSIGAVTRPAGDAKTLSPGLRTHTGSVE